MTLQLNFMRRHLARLVAISLLVVAYGLARQPVLSTAERSELATHFRFSRESLPALPNSGELTRNQIRNVHPSLKRIAAWISSVGAAAALADLDSDGLSNDLCYVDTRSDTVIVAPVPGTGDRYKPFALNPSQLPYDPATMAPMGCLTGDLNEDGKTDVLVYYWGRTPVVFLRQEKGFLPREVVPGGERWFTNAGTLADLNGDSHVDLVFANYFPDGSRILDAKGPGREAMQESMSRATNGGRKHLLLWNAATSGTSPTVQFKDASNALKGDITGWALAVGAVDMDGDLLPELYFANDFGPDQLWHNRSESGAVHFEILKGRKTFATPHSSVVGQDSFKGMGVDFADLNGDGLPDIFVSNITTDYGLLESNLVFLSTGNIDLMKLGIAPYVNRSEQLGLSRSGWSWDVKLADFNNDGMMEAVQAVGFVKGSVNRWPELQELAMGNDRLLQHPNSWPQFLLGDDLSGEEHDKFYARAKDGKYYDISSQLGFAEPQVTRGIAVADVDGDGGLDFAVANQWEESYYFHNTGPDRGAFLGLHLLLPLSPIRGATTWTRPGHPGADTVGRTAIGATATVYLPNGRLLVSQVDGGNGHSGKRSPELHFGLGSTNQGPIRVEVSWRDASGEVNRETLSLSLGWHTVMLGSAKGGSR